ncbi:MAG: hypothetical protein HDQ96_09755 [Lachnospiraceae bacterium]|nr:hypothetical protein [Lachnospiraceae bacterium]
MKKIKKLGALALAVALLVSMGMMSFAAAGDNDGIATLSGQVETPSTPGDGTETTTPSQTPGSTVTQTPSTSVGGGSCTPCSPCSTNSFAALEAVEKAISLKIDQAVEAAVAAGDEAGVVEIDGVELGISTFSSDVMQKLNDANVDAVITYDYDGNHYVITIPAGMAPVEEDVPWCGPLYLYAKFFDTAVVTPIE